MDHFRPTREVTSFLGDFALIAKLLLGLFLLWLGVSTIVDIFAANKSGMAFVKSEAVALPAKLRAAAGLK